MTKSKRSSCITVQGESFRLPTTFLFLKHNATKATVVENRGTIYRFFTPFVKFTGVM